MSLLFNAASLPSSQSLPSSGRASGLTLIFDKSTKSRYFKNLTFDYDLSLTRKSLRAAASALVSGRRIYTQSARCVFAAKDNEGGDELFVLEHKNDKTGSRTTDPAVNPALFFISGVIIGLITSSISKKDGSSHSSNQILDLQGIPLPHKNNATMPHSGPKEPADILQDMFQPGKIYFFVLPLVAIGYGFGKFGGPVEDDPLKDKSTMPNLKPKKFGHDHQTIHVDEGNPIGDDEHKSNTTEDDVQVLVDNQICSVVKPPVQPTMIMDEWTFSCFAFGVTLSFLSETEKYAPFYALLGFILAILS